MTEADPLLSRHPLLLFVVATPEVNIQSIEEVVHLVRCNLIPGNHHFNQIVDDGFVLLRKGTNGETGGAAGRR